MKKSTKAAIATAVVMAVAISAVVGLQLQSGPSSNSATNSKNSSSQQSGPGQFAIMATDPPVMADGADHAYAHYNGAAVHSAQSDNSSGWVKFAASGTIDLTGSADTGQTIASSQVQSGTYDMVRVNISSVIVTYNNVNYSATVATGTVTSRLGTEAQVSSHAAAEAVVDLRTFVMNTGSSTSPKFVFTSSAKATTVPPGEESTSSLELGAKTSLSGAGWWSTFKSQTSTQVRITSAAITGNSVQVQLQNSGSEAANVQTVVITPVSASGTAQLSLPATFQGSAVFTVNSAGSLQSSNSLQALAMVGADDCKVNSSSIASLGFTGNISLGFGLNLTLGLNGIIQGQQYLVTVMGANTYASTVVVAG
jgi:Domain of unknown function (DUF4382)